MELWIFFALLSSILFAIVSVLDKYAVYDKSGISPYLLNMYVGYSNLIVSLFFLALYLRSFNSYHFYALSVGFIQGLSLIALFWTLKKLSVTRTMTMWSSYPFWVALISFIFMDENLKLIQIVFMMIVITGSITSNISLKDSKEYNFSLISIFIIIFGTIFFATSQVLNKVVVSEITVLETYGLRGVGVCMTLALPFSSINNLKKLKDFVLDWDNSKYLFFAETIIATFAYLTILIALMTGPVSLVASLSGTRPVFIVLIYIVLNLIGLNLSEKLIKNEVVIKLFSALCVGIGVFGIAYF